MKVGNWKTVNLSPERTRFHQTASKNFQNFPGGNTPGHPSPDPFPAPSLKIPINAQAGGRTTPHI